jgi:hypothetical protein
MRLFINFGNAIVFSFRSFIKNFLLKYHFKLRYEICSKTLKQSIITSNFFCLNTSSVSTFVNMHYIKFEFSLKNEKAKILMILIILMILMIFVEDFKLFII